MRNASDISAPLRESILRAIAHRQAIRIVGAGTKNFYTGACDGEMLHVADHSGIIAYEPTELVITARAGTRLAEIESALAERGQMLGFEPPYFGAAATLGGTIACGFSGPRRPYAGAARDFVLGTRVINGRGEILKFGGEVMKNVAGYDVSRLMVGALGTLGVLLEISLKVLPKPAKEITLCFELPVDKAIATMNAWAGQPLPLSAACHLGGILYIRLSGTELGIRAAHAKLGGLVAENGAGFWRELREHQHIFYQGSEPLWRLSVPPAAAAMNFPGQWLHDWGGAQRWLRSPAAAADIYRQAENAGGHATLFRHAPDKRAIFHPLPANLTKLHQKLRTAFDPHGLLNRNGPLSNLLDQQQAS